MAPHFALNHFTILWNPATSTTTPLELCVSREDVSSSKMIGPTGKIQNISNCKLDHHNFMGLCLGYTATDQNIIYLDISSGIVKFCHHAVFDEAWYLQPNQPPAAQLLFDLGLEAETSFIGHDSPLHTTPIGTITPITVPWPPSLPVHHKLSTPPPLSIIAPLPLRLTAAPSSGLVHT